MIILSSILIELPRTYSQSARLDTASYWKDILSGNQIKLVEGFMKYHKLPYDVIWTHDKPIGIAYIDDKGQYVLTITGKILQSIFKITKTR